MLTVEIDMGRQTTSKDAVIVSPATSFISWRVNESTFLIIEDDSFDERPYIYVKIYPDHILITDTGCNSPRHQARSITSLRQYIEEFPLPTNEGQPLNPNGAKKYTIICSHCHYDHILGLPQFLDTTIIASSYDKDFLLKDRSHNSLCEDLGIPTPQYHITDWARHLGHIVTSTRPCRIQFLHVPGHTPDSLAWYDIDEHHLYVGDTFYERRSSICIPGTGFTTRAGAIIFPNEGGNLIEYMASINMLLSFTLFRNKELERQYKGDAVAPRVKVACGHNTFDADAEEMIREVKDLFERILAGKVSVYESVVVRCAINDFWLESEDAKYSVRAPRRLIEDARKHFRSTAS